MFTRVPLADVIGIERGKHQCYIQHKDQLTSTYVGAYILSVLEESSKNPEQNYGFTISFASSGQTTRVSSYSIRNSVDQLAKAMPPTPGLSSRLSHNTLPDPPDSSLLSDLLATMAVTSEGSVTSASFKALPVDDSTRYVHPGSDSTESDRLDGPTCRDAVERIVGAIRQACQDAGSAIRPYIVDRPIVR